MTVARKPNYNFERKERERIKAEKAAERAKAKAEKKGDLDLAAGEEPRPESSSPDHVAEGPGESIERS